CRLELGRFGSLLAEELGHLSTGLRIGIRSVRNPSINDVFGGGCPAAACGLSPIDSDPFLDHLGGCEGERDSHAALRRVLDRLLAVAGAINRRMRILARPGPYGHDLELVMGAIPGERFGVRPSLADQIN